MPALEGILPWSFTGYTWESLITFSNIERENSVGFFYEVGARKAKFLSHFCFSLDLSLFDLLFLFLLPISLFLHYAVKTFFPRGMRYFLLADDAEFFWWIKHGGMVKNLGDV